MRILSSTLFSPAAGGMFDFSAESTALFTALDPLVSVMALAFMGRSSVGKSLMAALTAQNYAVAGVFRIRVNPTNAAETQGIDAILMVQDDGRSGLLLLDTAGSDLGVTPLQTHLISTFALSVATSLVYFVDGELQDDEITRLAVSITMTNQIQGLITPPVAAPSKPRLTVAYSQVSSTRRFTVPAVEHTINRLTPLKGTICAARSIVNEQFPLAEINAVVVPLVEPALEGGTSLPAAEVLSRPGVEAALKPTAQALQTAPAAPAWVGRDLVQRLRQVMAAVTSAQGRKVMALSASSVDTFHSVALNKLVAEQRALEVAFLTAWERQQVGPGTAAEDAALRTTVAGRLTAVDVRVQADAQRMGATAAVLAITQGPLEALREKVRAELAVVIQRRVTARVKADNDAAVARARVAALAKNAEVLQVLQAERQHAHASSLTYGPHRAQYHQGNGNIFHKRRHHWTCGCGLFQHKGDHPGGSCPANPSHTQPTWEAWQAQVKADGSWTTILTQRGYDFAVA